VLTGFGQDLGSPVLFASGFGILISFISITIHASVWLVWHHLG
jgi:hypothetical protein